MIINFPPAFEFVIGESEKLADRGYTDQAILMLEELLEGLLEDKGRERVQKKLVTYHLLIGEVALASEIVKILLPCCLDLTTAAHYIIISYWEAGERGYNQALSDCQDILRLSPPSYHNLISLGYELKDFYEKEWARQANVRFEAFFQATGFEQTMDALDSLREVDKDYFAGWLPRIKGYFDNGHSRLYEAMLFFLLVEKGHLLTVTFEGERFETLPAVMEGFYQDLEKALLVLEIFEMETNQFEALRQHTALYYHFLFPNHHQAELPAVVYWISFLLLGAEFPGILDDFGILPEKSALTEEKVTQYLASLSL